MIQRDCNPSKHNSFFLFGPRGSGKTTFLQQTFSAEDTVFIDLLDLQLFDQLMLDVGRFDCIINSEENKNKRVVIDEIQKFPRLLDAVHSQIQKHKRQFILTGSSSRRLKQKGTNLLAGRAWVYHLYPFTTFELGTEFNLKKVLERGSLPDAFLAENHSEATEFLNAYVSTYLQKEIQEEQWVRKLSPFRKFLSIAAQMNGKIINKSKIAKDIGVDDVTVANYFEILEDTLIGIILPAYHSSVRKAQRMAPKFYFIDPGIKRALDQTLSIELLPQTNAYGEAFEHWIILDIIKNASYRRLGWNFSYLRTKDGAEIDFIIERPGSSKILIEIKSKTRIEESDFKWLEQLGTDIDPLAKKFIFSNDRLKRELGSSVAIYWEDGIHQLFNEKI